MSKKVAVLIIALVSIGLVAPLSAAGPGNWKKAQSPDTWSQSPAVLTETEIGHILFMREEEKLARDVYLTLYEQYAAAVFDNISLSEQRHMDALERLITKYGLEDPVVSDDVGEFSNPVFSDLYNELVERGLQNYCEALKVGIDIELLDIEDLEKALMDVEARDLERVLTNLLYGTENHLNGFTTQYEINMCD